MARRNIGMRRLQENYAKLTPEQQQKMGYGVITKVAGANAAAAPAVKAKPKAMTPRSQASAADLEQQKIKAEARATEEGNLRYPRERGLSGLRKAVGGR